MQKRGNMFTSNKLKKSLILAIFTFLAFKNIAQPALQFSACPGTNVMVYKDGTNCTEAPYNFYLLDLLGNLTAFGPPTAPGVEINAISISPTDRFLYGFQYTRTGTSSPCTFSNTRLIRMDAAGISENLGSIIAPVGGTIQNATGAVSSNGKFTFLAIGPSGLMVGVITNLESLTPSVSITPTYFPITNNCTGKNIADWAISPADGNLYSYATYAETVGVTTVMRGVMVRINLTTSTLECVGNVNTTELLDPVRDNFGGVMFGSDFNLYAININTRKFYKINPTTGDLMYVSTIVGSGNMRTDLGSCTSAPIILPLKIIDFSLNLIDCSAELSWKIDDKRNIKSQHILQSFDGINFVEVKAIFDAYSNKYTSTAPSHSYYKLKIVENDGAITYSPIKYAKTTCTENTDLLIIGNPTKNILVAQYKSLSKKTSLEIVDAQGRKVNKTNVVLEYGTGNIRADISNLAAGFYFLKVTNQTGELSIKSFIKN
jgi:hypothetical protein